jgi:transcriptional regulator with XRE-family HTH domain
MKDLAELLGIDDSDPDILRAAALVDEDHRLLRELAARRRSLGMSQEDMADLLGIKQPTVASFERYDSDPKLSTIRRYAHALGVMITHRIAADGPAHRAAGRGSAVQPPAHTVRIEVDGAGRSTVPKVIPDTYRVEPRSQGAAVTVSAQPLSIAS